MVMLGYMTWLNKTLNTEMTHWWVVS